ncbi:ATP-dependent Clp protease adapter ClpS [Brachybacterium huguangmaarense]|uniref:ATP-dependent Clp protease adapter protein ClpS n=1 Tax=Brachybacterium huguangmaarense TaxID=1652028 RepID=A0ABY6FY53_9MICO|nr:ATP-dependent Clp protease adapter ClpS [Brachybacterium huguangmaarense]UYG15837.1 ATP-dependent Clp protease adapter ClpS [Brachybacterium huguangmaarense]
MQQSTPRRSTAERPSVDVLESTGAEGPWATVVWNDPVNLMSYVVHVFRTHFGYTRARAEHLMLQVHQEGRAIVSEGSREAVEADVMAMHGYGLRATMERTSES